ncbi:emerin isoform X2 [Parambassis ranga]|uniref:Emerin isoform X2 n=1 Tax=Parambassis ranga TaxID=210632 RepID=A0A6P7IDE3_9TELE|nr:emerin-like isoform X2 [Parambassis ranga]
MSLSSKSAQEISELLDEYGIKHGPVVDSTRSLYEKKLKEAMAKEKRAKPSPDKTYYREEEQVTYVYKTPVRSDSSGDSGAYMRARPEWAEREYEHETSNSRYSRSRPEYKGRDFVDEPYMYDSPDTYKHSYLKSAAPMKSSESAPKAAKSSPLIPLWVQFVFFLAMAVFLYLVFTNMETNESLKGIE